jgi:nucleoside-diphosphate-sugar epimerase
MRALVTGAGGFVGRHLLAALVDDGWETFAAGGPADEGVDARLDIRDGDATRDVVERAEPDVVFHLAAQSFVPESLADPKETYEINVLGTANLAEALRRFPRRRFGADAPRSLGMTISPRLAGGEQSSPRLAGGEQSFPRLAGGEQSFPRLAEGEQSSPRLAEGEQSSLSSRARARESAPDVEGSEWKHRAIPRLLFISSAEVYGARDAGDLPLRESLAPHPANPYAASKAAAEAILIGEMRALGGDVVIARAFNHIGPGQSERFAIAGFALGLAKIAAGGEKMLLVGNLDAARDFLDVRDVVQAYVALAKRGERGEIYNVCSGKAVAIRDLLGELIRIAKVPVEVRADPERMRPADVAISVGSNAKLVERTGWSPRRSIAQSLRDIYADARNRSGL